MPPSDAVHAMRSLPTHHEAVRQIESREHHAADKRLFYTKLGSACSAQRLAAMPTEPQSVPEVVALQLSICARGTPRANSQ